MWYKLWCEFASKDHPHVEEFIYTEKPFSGHIQRFIWFDWMQDQETRLNARHLYGDMEVVDTLPENERQNYLKTFRDTFNSAIRKLRSLQNMRPSV